MKAKDINFIKETTIKKILILLVLTLSPSLFAQAKDWVEYMFDNNISSRHMVLEKEGGVRQFITIRTYEELEADEPKKRPFYLIGYISSDPSYFMDKICLVLYVNGEKIDIVKLTLMYKMFAGDGPTIEFNNPKEEDTELWMKNASDVLYRFRWAEERKNFVEILSQEGKTYSLNLSTDDFANIGQLADFYQTYRRSSRAPRGMTQPYAYEINRGRQ